MADEARSTSTPHRVYEITIQGIIDQKWSDWFDGMTIVPQADGRTRMIGPVVDQSALYGLLNKIHNLGLSLIAITCTADESKQEATASRQKGEGK